MDQERLWAPWRLGYIKGTEEKRPEPEPSSWLDGAEKGCFLCRAAAEPNNADFDKKLFVVSRDQRLVVLLNRYPYSNGPLLISPRRHTANLGDLTDDEHLAISQTIRCMTDRLGTIISCLCWQAYGCYPSRLRRLGRVCAKKLPKMPKLLWARTPRVS